MYHPSYPPSYWSQPVPYGMLWQWQWPYMGHTGNQERTTYPARGNASIIAGQSHAAEQRPASEQTSVSEQRRDYGPRPLVVNIEEAAENNRAFRTALWTGSHLQVTLMSIGVGEDIGVEIHPNVDQFLRIEEGEGVAMMGHNREQLDFQRRIGEDFAIIVPAGTWHNIVNTGNKPLKLYSIYAPPHHPHGTVHLTKAAAMAAEAMQHQHS